MKRSAGSASRPDSPPRPTDWTRPRRAPRQRTAPRRHPGGLRGSARRTSSRAAVQREGRRRRCDSSGLMYRRYTRSIRLCVFLACPLLVEDPQRSFICDLLHICSPDDINRTVYIDEPLTRMNHSLGPSIHAPLYQRSAAFINQLVAVADPTKRIALLSRCGQHACMNGIMLQGRHTARSLT